MACHSYRHSDAQTARSIVPSVSGVGLTGLVKLGVTCMGWGSRLGVQGRECGDLLLSRFCHVAVAPWHPGRQITRRGVF